MAAEHHSPSPAVQPFRTSPQGPSLSRIVAGAWRMADWQLSAEARATWIEDCLELGISTFDHADIYGDYRVEALFGEALAASPGLRERIQLVSKCGIRLVSAQRPENRLKSYDTSPSHVRASVEASLRALRTDRLDLLLIHRPDALMRADALAACFEELRVAGKVLHFGVSNHTPSQFALLQRHVPLATHQIECSPLHLAPLHDGTLDQCQELGIAPMIWSPLAGGRLFTGDDARARSVRGALEDAAAAYGVTPTSFAYAWLLRHPSHPLPITGSRRVEVLREAAAACAVALDAQTWYQIWAAGAGHEVA
jgi:predicted oxidoreductase